MSTTGAKIVHLRATNFYGGPERQLHEHAKALCDTTYEITIASFVEQSQRPDLLQRAEVDGIKTFLLDVKSAYDFSAIKMIRNYLNENRTDIICTHDYRSHAIGFRARRGTRCRWVAFSRGWTSESLKIKTYHALDKIIVRFATHIVAVSRAQKDKLVRLMISGDKISVVHNAVDAAAVRAVRPVNLKKKFDFPENAYVVISGGRFSREKGQAFFVQAAVEAVKTDDRLRFVLFGDGPDLASMRRLVSSSGNDQKIICPGFERNLLGCLADADCLVNPSLSEGLPNIILEAMAAGTPVVATAVGGVPELITDGLNGLLVPPQDAASLRAKIITLATDTDTGRDIAAAARETVGKDFTFASQGQKLIDVYQRTLAR
jgi:glycosyltransferase involved in cell wall biosynthesis